MNEKNLPQTTNNSNTKSVVKEYLEAFANKDASRLSSLLALNASLRDWTQFAEGRVNVMTANQSIFDVCSTVSVDLLNLFGDEKTAIAEIEVRFDGGDPIHIVDVYEFDSAGKIVGIRAFQG